MLLALWRFEIHDYLPWGQPMCFGFITVQWMKAVEWHLNLLRPMPSQHIANCGSPWKSQIGCIGPWLTLPSAICLSRSAVTNGQENRHPQPNPLLPVGSASLYESPAEDWAIPLVGNCSENIVHSIGCIQFIAQKQRKLFSSAWSAFPIYSKCLFGCNLSVPPLSTRSQRRCMAFLWDLINLWWSFWKWCGAYPQHDSQKAFCIFLAKQSLEELLL